MKYRLLAILEILTAAGIALYWVLFYSRGLSDENPSPCYLCYERAFPIPDAALATALLAAGVFLIRKHALGRLLTQASGGALVFLGFLDVSFNLQNGIYQNSAVDLIMNLLINGWCILFGVAQLILTRHNHG